MTAHILQRARERLGVDLTAEDERAILAVVQSGRLQAIPATGDRRAWFELAVQGVPAWILYDYAARSLVTILGERPASLTQSCPTLYALADEYGLSHAEAKRIAGRKFEHLRHAHKSDRLTGCQARDLRPLFEAAKKEKAPVEKPEGYALSLLVQKTGLGESKIKMILSRHAELQEMPYSTKAGGSRVFFDPFVEWLATYEGKAESQKSRPVTTVTKLPAGIQLHELRMIYGPDGAARRLDYILGYAPRAALPEPSASDAEAAKGFAALDAVASGLPPAIVGKATRASAAVAQAVIRRELAAASADSRQGRLGL